MDRQRRWLDGDGPGARKLPWTTRLKRTLVGYSAHDARIRRMALNKIFADYSTPGVLCLVPFGDHSVYVDPRDDRIAYSLLSGRSWQRDQLVGAFDDVELAGRLRAGGVFVDVGANIGLMTVYALLSGRFARAIAIEPDAHNRAILTKNIEENGFADRVTIVGRAVSDVIGAMVLHRDTKNLGAHSLEPGFSLSADAASGSVDVAPLDTILADAGHAPEDVAFVKIDVEGHEFAVLNGMPELISARVPMMIEVTFGGAAAGGNSSDARAEDLAALVRLLPGYHFAKDLEGGDDALAGPLVDFPVRAGQHELLIY